MKISAVIQARTGSTRLPGKVMLTIKDKPILQYVIERLKQSKLIDDLIIATTISRKDDIIEQFSKDNGILFFRGSEEDVLDRYYRASVFYGVDIIVRVTSDCPFVDSAIMDNFINVYQSNNVDYVSSYDEKETYPRGIIAEVFSFTALEEAHRNARKQYQREHVTPYLYKNPSKFKLINIEAKGKIKRPDIRLTLDTPEDFELIKKIIQHFDDVKFRLDDIIDFLNENPHLLEINKNIKQKNRRIGRYGNERIKN
ncbi:unnamed protein product [marine sediment metagenome]|uniref:Acylneuraminate cytidylyltransferase n=1 Tax=marine sediment metagenome TaxID=412755 RepID=X0S7Z1_9ZZZZ